MALVITVPIKCPICKKIKKPGELKEIQNSYNGGDETIYGHALITDCCKAVVAKSDFWDYNRGAFKARGAREKLVSECCEIIRNLLVVYKKPEIVTEA